MPQASYRRGAKTIYDDTDTTDKYITLYDWRLILYLLSSSNNTALLSHENNKFNIQYLTNYFFIELWTVLFTIPSSRLLVYEHVEGNWRV